MRALMQTIEGYVVNSRVNAQRNSWRSAPVLVASAIAILGFGVSLAVWSRMDAAPHAKFEARAAPISLPTPQAESDLAAFQQAIALSHLAHVDPLKVEAPATSTPVSAPTREPAPRLAQTPVRKPAPVASPRPVAIAAPDPPPAPPVEPAADRGFPIIGGFVRQVGALPTQARGLASDAGDRFLNAVSLVREKTGL
jgi:hypothetical protein